MQYDDMSSSDSRSASNAKSSVYPEEPYGAAPRTTAPSLEDMPGNHDDYVTTPIQPTESSTTSSSSEPSDDSFGGDNGQPMTPMHTGRSSSKGIDDQATSTQEDEDFSVDFDKSITSEEHRLMEEIDEDIRREEELERGPKSRAALMASPLLQAAAAAALASSNGRVDDASIDVSRGSLRWGSSRHNDSRHSSVSLNAEQESAFLKEPPQEQYLGAATGLQLPDQDDYSYHPDAQAFDTKERKQKVRRRRRMIYIFGWVLSIAMVTTSVTIILMRRGDNKSDGPDPTPTESPSREPSFRTRSPTTQPTTSRPTFAVAPTDPPSINPIPTPAPTTRPLTPSPTSAPIAVTPAPTLSEAEEERRADITSLCIQVSGLTAIMDTSSPEFAACQWIQTGDPMQLLASDMPAVMQRYVLATLYFSTNEDNTWVRCGSVTSGTPCDSRQQRYLGGESECGWLGVTCSADGIIEGLNLRDNGLQGDLIQELGVLSRLESLVLSSNGLSSAIPTVLGRLRNLRVLLLNRNRLTGRIPTQLGSLSSIWYLHLGNNKLTGPIPSTILVRSLQHIDLGDNTLSGALPSNRHLSSPYLINIDVSNNEFAGPIPSDIGMLSLLQSFTADNNRLTGSLSGSLFTSAMTVFDVSYNLLEGRIPEELFDFGTSLTLLNLGHNLLIGNLSRRFEELSNLEQLVLWHNDFVGTIPSRFGSLTNLEVLHLGQTQLDGTMPDEVCNLRTFPLRILSADCDGNPPEVECNCCSVCFPSG